MRKQFYCSYEKACHCLWAVLVKNWTLTQTAIVLELNVGTVSHIVRRRRFRNAVPQPIPGY